MKVGWGKNALSPPSFHPEGAIVPLAPCFYATFYFTDRFSGPGRAIGQVCVCVCMRVQRELLN